MSVPIRMLALLCLTIILLAASTSAFAQQPAGSVVVTLKSETAETNPLNGRILAETDEGVVLLEDRAGRIHQLKASEIADRTQRPEDFAYLNTEEMSADLLREIGGGFAIRETDHFVICSDASELYTRYCGRLLEKVHDEFYKLFQDSPVKLRPISHKLPVMVFRQAAVFQEFARRQHPDTDFSDVPGYYSIRDNQMLIAAVSGDRNFRTNSDVIRELKKRPRQVETIVHEAVHQLSFNSGLQVRYADNPMWLSEGLAVYFETATGRSSLIWSRPGEPSRTHLPGFRNAASGTGLKLPLSQLLASDDAFQSQDQLAHAYAEGWAVMLFLIRSERDAFDQLMLRQQQRMPLVPVSANARLEEIAAVTDGTPAELEATVIRFMSRVRDRR